MVVTSRMLQDSWGIDSEIADYFANKRPVPKDNLFWKNKRIYISGGFGYLTIPFAYDLIFKLGIPKNDLLKEEHVTLTEVLFDWAIQYEKKQTDLIGFLDGFYNFTNGKIVQENLANDLFSFYRSGVTKHFNFQDKKLALARSDIFLFTLIDLNITDEWVTHFLPYWYALARPILLLDDFKDLEQDRLENEENAILEFGDGAKGIKAAYELGINDLKKLSEINPMLSKKMLTNLNGSLQYDYIRKNLS